MRWLALPLIIAACSAAPASGECPAKAAEPRVPAETGRTVEALGQYANNLRHALTVTGAARDECARRLRAAVEAKAK